MPSGCGIGFGRQLQPPLRGNVEPSPITMKLLLHFFRLTVFTAILFLLAALTSCTGKSNAEDDTFRQSIIDDPVKAQRENEAAKLNKKMAPPDSTRRDTLTQQP